MTDILGSIAAAGQAASTGIGGFLGLLPTSAKATTCDASLAGACLQKYTTTDKVTYGVGIPDTATASAPYDILVSMTAPSTVGWAGVAMGGGMVGSPLIVGWPSPNGPVVTVRMATEHAPGKPDPNVTLTMLASSTMSATSWRVDVLCSGCSRWVAPDGTPGSIDPAKSDVKLAYAANTGGAGTVTTPASNTSAFAIHSTLGGWNHDFAKSKLANFADVVSKPKAAAAAPAAAPAGGAAAAPAAAAPAPPAKAPAIKGRRGPPREASGVPAT